MKKTRLISVIIDGLCAIVWSVNVICGLVSKAYLTSSFSFILDVLCAVCWIAAFVVRLVELRSLIRKIDKSRFVKLMPRGIGFFRAAESKRQNVQGFRRFYA